MFIYTDADEYARPLFSLAGAPGLQIAAQTGGEQLKDGVLSLPAVRQAALHHILGIHDRGCEDMEPQQILIDLVETREKFFERLNHTDKRIKIGYIPVPVILWKKSAVPEAVIEDVSSGWATQNRK